jgi:hypothetical protein
VILEATTHPANEIHWYASATDQVELFSGESYSTNLSQTTSFFTAASIDYFAVDSVGPGSKDIGGGADHAGGRYLILDAIKPFRLKSATVYATGAANRTFQLKDVNGAVLLEKTVFINDGTQRIILDMDIPQGVDLQLGCISPAGLFRNSSGVSYPYSIPEVAQIKSSTGGIDYYYYLYDMDIESSSVCESERVEILGIIDLALAAPVVTASGVTALCPGDSVLLTAENVCVDCTVHWSNGASGPSISVTNAGNYTATVRPSFENTCGDSPASNLIVVTENSLPGATTLTTSGQTTLCPGTSVELAADNVCPDCNVQWSNGLTGNSITVSDEGTYTAVLRNTCGDGPVSNEAIVSTVALPESPTITAAGATSLCPGASVQLVASDLCPDCIVNWSNGETGPIITVSTDGLYTATSTNLCGESAASNPVSIVTETLPSAPVVEATGSTALCPGETVMLTAANVCPECTLNWSNGNTTQSIVVSSEGVYTATVINSCGESSASNAITVSMGALPVIPAITAAGLTVLCPGESVVLTADNLCTDCTVQWSNGETGTSITVTTSGDYTAMFQNSCGESSASNVIQVQQSFLPDAPEIGPLQAVSLCFGASTQLEVLSGGGFGIAINWSNGATGPSIIVSTPGVYTAFANDLNNFCGESLASNAVTVTVDPPFLPVLQNNMCQLVAPAGSDYQWFLDGVEISGANGPTWSAMVAGYYAVSMTNAEGCTGVSDTLFSEACVSSVQDLESRVLARVYPNPTQDRVFMDIQVLRVTSAHLELYAADGRFITQLFQGDLVPGAQILDIALPVLPGGIYQYRLTTEMGIVNGNLVIQHR